MKCDLLTLLRLHGLPEPEREVVAVPGRRFRFDYAWVEQRVACDLQGGIWTRGKHVRGAGYMRDITKLNEAQLAGGWRVVLWICPDDVTSGRAVGWIRRALEV